MNKLFICLMIFSPCVIIAQTSMDSIAVRQLDSLIKVSRSLTTKKQTDEAFKTIAVAEKMVLEKWGRESAAYGSVCFSRARVFQFLGNLPESEKWYQESKLIREKILGKENVDYANSLNNLAMVLQKMAKYTQAEQLFLESKSIREKILGKEHPDYAWSLNNLATLYWIMCKYEKAELNFLELKDLWAKILGEEDLEYAECLNDLGGLYFDMGKYDLAEQYFTDCKSIQEKVLGKEDPEYAWSLNNMGLVYKDQGKFEKAEQLFLEAKSIREKILGKEHKDYSNSLTILASLYEKQGNYESALSNLLEAKTIADKLLSKENPLYTFYLTNLGIIYRVMGQFNLAEPYLLEAKAILEKTLGKEHENYAWTLDGLANLYMAMGNYIKAEPIYLESKSIYEKVLGKEHPEYASCLNNLAILYSDLEHYDTAEKLYLESIAIRKKILGKEHQDYTESLMNLGLLYISKGNYEKAESLYGEFDQLNQLQISKALHYLSEQELVKYINTFSNNQSNLFSLTQLTHGERLTSTCYDNALFHKGFLLNAALELKHLAHSEPAASDKINLLNTLNRQLANQYSKPFSERDSIKVNQLEFKANEIEKDIVRNVAGYRESVRQIHWKEIQLSLTAGEVAVEFVNYKFIRKKATDSIMYAALLLRAGDKEPQFISLFEEKQLDSLLKVIAERKADYVNNLYFFEQRGAVVIGKSKSSLYDLIWKPLEPMLKDITKIYYAPSGQLHRVNLGAIAISEDQTLVDKYKLVQLKSTRQLVVPNISNTVKDDAILFGGIKFDLDSTALKNDFKEDVALRFRGITGDLGFEYVDTSLCNNYAVLNAKLEKKQNSRTGKKAKLKSRGDSWTYLPGTEKEVATIEKILQNSNFTVRTNKGYEASEEAFKNIGQNGIPSPRILHIATHGYFFPDPERSISAKSGVTHDLDDAIGTSSEGTAKAAKSTLNYNLKDEPIFKISDHPMLRSGLILAGGNTAWQGTKTLEGHEDGILTAYEISQMNLSNTELVVLSACETGLGDIQGNEGVYGLQRAFKIAGAKFLIFSLWQVPDKQTSELMKSFYQKWLVEKMSLPDAFHSAQKDMHERFVDPYAWAGFVLLE